MESGSLVVAGRSLLLSVATQVSLKSWTSTREKLDVNQTLLAEIVARILTVARPERIILFGSAVSGQAVGMPSSSVREKSH